jgi:uncharacterized damage-inducible protein DinB
MYKAIVAMLLAAVLSPLAAQEKGKEDTMTGFRAEYIGQIQFVKGRILDLAQAIPQESYTWRPADGVRSISEVYRHIAFANYSFIKLAGYTVPSDAAFDGKAEKWEKATTNKEEIVKSTERSFDAVVATVKEISDADLEKTVKVYGREMTLRNFMLSSLGHIHEHLGQSIAYARMNKVVPPWTAKAEAAAKKKK